LRSQMREQLVCMAGMKFQQLGIRPLFDGVRYWVLTGVDRSDKRDGLVKELAERVDECL